MVVPGWYAGASKAHQTNEVVAKAGVSEAIAGTDAVTLTKKTDDDILGIIFSGTKQYLKGCAKLTQPWVFVKWSTQALFSFQKSICHLFCIVMYVTTDIWKWNMLENFMILFTM